MLNISDGTTALPFVIQLQASVMSAEPSRCNPWTRWCSRTRPPHSRPRSPAPGGEWQWFEDGKRVPGARSATLTILKPPLAMPVATLRECAAALGSVTPPKRSAWAWSPNRLNSSCREAWRHAEVGHRSQRAGLRFRWFTCERDTGLPVMLSQQCSHRRCQQRPAHVAKTAQRPLGPLCLCHHLGRHHRDHARDHAGGPSPSSSHQDPLCHGLAVVGHRGRSARGRSGPGALLRPASAAGLELNETTGEITGAPRQPGRYRVGFWVVSEGGTSPVVEQVVTVRRLPAGLAGTDSGWLERNGNHNDGLGGQWSLTIRRQRHLHRQGPPWPQRSGFRTPQRHARQGRDAQLARAPWRFIRKAMSGSPPSK